MKRSMIFSLILTLLFASLLYAQIPQTISYQGVLTDASGNPVLDGSYNLGFKLYDVATGGTALWSENQSKSITNGMVDVILGSVNPLNLPFDKTYWLGISINQGAELSPRIQLTSSPYSLNARTVPDASLTAAKIAHGQVVKSLNALKDNVRLVAGSNISIATNGDSIKISATPGGSGGDITGVIAGNGLTDGGLSGDVTLNVGAGTGITVTADQVSLNTSYTDQLYVKNGQANAITSAMIVDGTIVSTDLANSAVATAKIADNAVTTAKLADNTVTTAKLLDNAVTTAKITDNNVTTTKLADNSVTAAKIAPNIVSSINGVINDGSNIDLVAGANIQITPSNTNKTITISATTNGSGGCTLDQAYDFGGPGAGRKIIADAGAVWISGTGELQGLVVDGKVGIGVANPQAKLDVQYWPAKQLRLKGIGSKGYWNVFHNADQYNDYGFSIADSLGTEWFALNRLSYRNNIYLKGNVGIGTYEPKGDLHIASTGDTKLRFSNGDNHEATIVYDIDSDGLEFRMGGTGTDPKFFIGDVGNVGIGTISPSAKLHVQGDMNISTTITAGKIQAGGTTTQSIAIYGKGTYGVKGENSANTRGGYLGTDDWGVYGYAPASTNYAGYFSGNVHILGHLSKTSGSFKIDHPLDPENKYLYHSFVESPDMMNIYNGNVVLDANGEAIVQLPDWFGALNRDFRYQLTAIGAPGPNIYIAEEISNNRFKIAGGTAGMKVSWQVTGIRQDAYANAHRIPVEEMKKGEERGKYLHPEVFNQPETMGIDYAERHKIEQEMK